jgi:hypothetical protein
MTFSELLSILNGEYKETAGTSAKNQCVDLANAYLKYVLGLPPIEWTNAVDFPSKAGDQFEYILNTPTGVPQEGDLVIWGGTYGHIAIFLEGSSSRFTSFDENFPTGSPCHVQEHNYTSPKVLGWLHFKGNLPTGNSIDPIIIQHADNWLAMLQRYNFSDNKDLVFAEVDKLPKLEDAVRSKDQELNKKIGEIEELKKEIKKLQEQAPVVVDTTDKLAEEVHENTATVNTFDESIKKALVRLSELEDYIQKPLTGFRKTLYDILLRLLKF